jgi:hypothetical protein
MNDPIDLENPSCGRDNIVPRQSFARRMVVHAAVGAAIRFGFGHAFVWTQRRYCNVRDAGRWKRELKLSLVEGYNRRVYRGTAQCAACRHQSFRRFVDLLPSLVDHEDPSPKPLTRCSAASWCRHVQFMNHRKCLARGLGSSVATRFLLLPVPSRLLAVR